MKHGKRPTRNQKQRIKARGLNAENWLVVKDTPDLFLVVHRHTGKPRALYQRQEGMDEAAKV